MARSQVKRASRVKSSSASGRAEGPSPSYADMLRARIADPEHSKGQRTRWTLLASAAEMLEERGYTGLRVTDVNEKAGVSNALFYLYFKNKEEITREVMTGFLEVLFARDDASPKPQSVEEAIFRGNYDYLRHFAANPGLMRCLMQFGDEISEFGRLWRESSHGWVARVARRLAREPELAGRDLDELSAQVTALGAMVDGYLRAIYVEKVPSAVETLKAIAPDAAARALFLTQLWVRAIYCRDMHWSPGDSLKST